MIIVDKILTIKRINKHMKQLAETMESYETYKKNIDLAKKLSVMLHEDKNSSRIFFSTNNFSDEKSFKVLRRYKRDDVICFIKDHLMHYSHDDLKIFKLLVNSEINRPHHSEIENIAFAGGGAKGIAYPGALRKFSELSMDIKRVSGTSAGAITALPFALGYSPRKIEEIVLKYDFTRFMYESVINDNPILHGRMMKSMMHQSKYLEVFKNKFKNSFLNYLKDKPSFFARLDMPLNIPKNCNSAQQRILIENHFHEKFLPSLTLKSKLSVLPLDEDLKELIKTAQNSALDAYKDSLSSEKDKNLIQELMNSMRSKHNGKSYNKALIEFIRLEKKEDLIEEFFADLIENKLSELPKKRLEAISEGLSSPERIRNLTFTEFKAIREEFKDSKASYKDLAICICEKISDNPLKLFSKENYKQIDVYADNPDPQFSEMPIKTAVRISMNLPAAFSSYEYKGKKYVDGGVRANFPLHFFDTTLKMDRRKTMGFCLAPAENFSRTEDASKILNPERRAIISDNNLLKRAIIHVKNYLGDVITQVHGDKLDNNKKMDFIDLTRIGVINVLDIETTHFNLDIGKKIKLFKQGYYSANDALTPNYNIQLRHYVERMKVVFSKVEKDLDILNTISKEHYDNIMNNFEQEGSDLEAVKKYITSLQHDVHYDIGGRISRRKNMI